MTGRWPVELKDKHSGHYVRAVLIERVDPAIAGRAESDWKEAFDAAKKALRDEQAVGARNLQHSHWRWREKVEATYDALPFQTLGIECESRIQGLMLIRTAGAYSRHPSQRNMPQVYIELVATAPWNLPGVVQRPRFSGVGNLLLRAAIEISKDLEFKGRIGLHSLPQSEPWYEGKCGMVCFGPDADKEHLKYYEMTPAEAEAFLR